MNRFSSKSVIILAAAVLLFCWAILGTAAPEQRIAAAYEPHASVPAAPALAPSPTPVSASPKSDLTILISGDIMLDRNVRLAGNRYGYDSLFSSVSSLFAEADISVANLEGTITGNPSKTLLPDGRTTKSFVFTFATSTAPVLARSGISLVSLANNHTDAYGQAGLNETRKWLSQAGIGYFGDPWNSSSTEAVISKNGVSVAFVGYHAFQSGFDRVVSTVRRLSAEGNFVIVMPHWGEEYVTVAPSLLKGRARTLIAAGANAIIGSHPHVVMDHEWIGGVPVFYSLGNLLFDQYFSPEVMKGNIVELHIEKTRGGPKLDHVSIYETSLESRRGVIVNPVPVDEKP